MPESGSPGSGQRQGSAEYTMLLDYIRDLSGSI